MLRIVPNPRRFLRLLPNRLDCTAALAPGILTYETVKTRRGQSRGISSVLVKVSSEVLVSVHEMPLVAWASSELHQAIEREFLNLDEQEKMYVQSSLNWKADIPPPLCRISHE